jgi:polar amino acid transport system permease protein
VHHRDARLVGGVAGLYEELTFAANLIQSRTFLSFEVYLVTTGIYLALSITMRQLLMAAGRKWLGVQA